MSTPSLDRESVWDYPRPPRVEATGEHVHIVLAERVLADTRTALRVLETSHPPVYYVPMRDIDITRLRQTREASWCEYKGTAAYWEAEGRPAIGWSYPDPSPGFEALVDHIAFFPGRVDRASVDGELAQPQQGGFYGGWITSRVEGPFKGGAGTAGW